MRNRLLMGMMALGAVIASAAPAGAVTDRNTSERGQPKPFVDTPHAMGHVNAMMQERYAAAGGPAERTAVAFAEDIVKTLPLIPGASVITNGATLPSGNVLIGSGRGLGFSNMSLHNTVTGQVIWSAPRFLGPTDYLLRRTIGPGSYLGGISPAVSSTGQVAGWAFMTDGYNSWAFDAETGDEKWVVSQDDWPPGPQRLREEPLRDRSMSNDLPIGFPFLPEAIRAPSGEHVVGSLFTRGNFAYLDSLNGDLVILQNGDDGDLAVGIKQPILFTIIDLLCFPGGQIALSIKDWCSAFVYTRYFSANTTMTDPIRNRITVTYAGDAETFDRFMTWEVVTDNGPGQPGTILPDPDIEDGQSPAFNLVWSTNFGVNSGATPTFSDSGAVIFGVDGAGITNAFDANTGDILVSSTGGGAGFSPSTDHNDLLVICSPDAGLAQVSPVDGSFLFQNPATGLGLEHLAVMPDSPLLIDGRPSEECVGFPGTHPDIYQAQFVLGYPNALFGALAALGIPVPSTITSGALADFQVDAQTGETIPTNFRTVYNGSGEATLTTLDSGRYLSARVDAVAAIYAGIINLLLPRRFDVPPAEAGFVISEPLSFRDSVRAQFEGAAQYCEEVLEGRFGPAGDPIARPLPIVVGAPDAFNKERELQLAVNKVGYINSIMKKSVPGRISSARNDRSPPEIGDLELAFIVGNISDIVIGITLARELLLCNVDPNNNCSDGLSESSGLNPNRATQNLARDGIEAACEVIEQSIDILQKETCTDDSQCDDGNECTSDACNVFGVCDNTPAEGASCEGGTCDAEGNCIVGPGPCDDVICTPTGNECTANRCNPANGQCEVSDVSDGTPCDGGSGTCQAGVCTAADLCDGVVCEDDNECTENVCDAGDCSYPAVADGTACDGGAGSCDSGVCLPFVADLFEVTRFSNVRLLTQDRIALRADFDGVKPDDDDVVSISLDGQEIFSDRFGNFRRGLLGGESYENRSLLGLDVTLDFGEGELRVRGTVRPKLDEDELADGLTVTLQMGDDFSGVDTVPVEIILGVLWTLFDEEPTPPGTPGPAELPSGDDFAGDLAPNGPFYTIEWPTRVPARSGTLAGSLYVPSEDGEQFGPGPYPLVIVTPGFGAGHKAYDNYSKHMASWGFAVIGIDFTNAGDHPQSAEDILDTIDWVEQGLSPLGDSVDTNFVATAGHSAGGKVAFGAASIDPDRIGAVIGWDPVNAGGPPCDILIFGSSDDPDAFCNRDPVAPNPLTGQTGIMDTMAAASLTFASPPGGPFTPEQHAANYFYDGTVNADAVYVLFPDGRHINWGPTAGDNNFEAQVGKPSGMAWLLRHLLGVSGPGIDAYIPPQAEGIEVQSKSP